MITEEEISHKNNNIFDLSHPSGQLHQQPITSAANYNRIYSNCIQVYIHLLGVFVPVVSCEGGSVWMCPGQVAGYIYTQSQVQDTNRSHQRLQYL